MPLTEPGVAGHLCPAVRALPRQLSSPRPRTRSPGVFRAFISATFNLRHTGYPEHWVVVGNASSRGTRCDHAAQRTWGPGPCLSTGPDTPRSLRGRSLGLSGGSATCFSSQPLLGPLLTFVSLLRKFLKTSPRKTSKSKRTWKKFELRCTSEAGRTAPAARTAPRTCAPPCRGTRRPLTPTDRYRPAPHRARPEPGLRAPPWPGLAPPHSWDTCAGHMGSHGVRLTPLPNTEVQGAGVTPALHSGPVVFVTLVPPQ